MDGMHLLLLALVSTKSLCKAISDPEVGDCPSLAQRAQP